jgi:hypothetical protein
MRNLWSYGLVKEKPGIELISNEITGELKIANTKVGAYSFYFQKTPTVLFTENETNTERLYNVANKSPFVKDAFHNAVIHEDFALFSNKKMAPNVRPFITSL